MKKGENLEIEGLSVTLKTLKVDGKRLSRSIFNQVPVSRLSPVAAKQVLGWVNVPKQGAWVLFVGRRGLMRRDISVFTLEGLRHFDHQAYRRKISGAHEQLYIL